MKFEIGQHVWRATFMIRQNSVECADCGGTGRLRVLFHDDTMVSVECAGCSRGFERPTGRIVTYDRTGRAEPDVITGVEIEGGKTRWRTANSYRVDETDVFATEQEALERAAVLAAEYDAAELARIATKEKPTRTWAWNAHYHRDCIKRCEREIERHKAKLTAANLKARIAKAEKVSA
jgi:ribosomal protein S27E